MWSTVHPRAIICVVQIQVAHEETIDVIRITVLAAYCSIMSASLYKPRRFRRHRHIVVVVAFILVAHAFNKLSRSTRMKKH